MDIKYNVSKYKDSKIQEVKDSVSIEEPLEMRFCLLYTSDAADE